MARKSEPTPVARLTWDQVAAFRLRRHHLHERAPRARLLEVVADIAGVHAQLMSSAELTLWARVDDLEPDAVSSALWEQRALVKSWAMRGTLHLLPAAEYPIWQAGFSTYRHYLKASWFRYFKLSREQLEQLMAAVAQALDGPPLTRDELAAAVVSLTGEPGLGERLADSWGAVLKPASFRGHLCFAPNRGQNVRFTRPDRWLSGWRKEIPEHALEEVTRRFLAANGPATREDLARWWAVTPAGGGAQIARLGDDVTQVDVEGSAAVMLAADIELIGDAPPRSVRLVPAFDQYVVGATRHAAQLGAEGLLDRIYRPQGWLSPVLLVGGRMSGVWRHELKGKRLLVRVEPFTKLPAWARRGAAEEAERLAAFLGGELDLEVG